MFPGAPGWCADKVCFRISLKKTGGIAKAMTRLLSRGGCYSLAGELAGAVFCISLLLLAGCAGPENYQPDRETVSHEIATDGEIETASYYQTGIASYYGKGFQNKKTASGERFDLHSMTAAHKTLPFGTKVIVKNLLNGKTVAVRINDRGPFVKWRIIDLSTAAFSQISSLDDGLAKVELRIVK
jgi:hypothetical protein